MKSRLVCFCMAGLLFLFNYSLAQSTVVASVDIAQIRTLRVQSNRAIQARDLVAFGQTMLPDIEVTRGSGPHLSGRDSVLASVAVQFRDATFLGYVRETDSIRVSTSGPLAAEQGHWAGSLDRPFPASGWHPDADRRLSGDVAQNRRGLENPLRAFCKLSLHRQRRLWEVIDQFFDKNSSLPMNW